MNKEKCIYLIKNNFDNKQYIGVAENFDKRMYQHAIGHDAEHSYIDKSILEHGWENFESIIIDNYQTLEERKELEKKYIVQYKTHRSQGGYNLTWGGEDVCFPNTVGSNNPRAQLNEDDIRDIRIRRMNGERMSDVYELYAYKLEGNSRAGFSKAWLHESWVDICAEFKGHYPEVSSKYFATKRRNEFTDKEKVFLTKYFKWNGPISKYSELYKQFKHLVDWQTFQEICKEIVDNLYGNKNTRKYRNKNGETERRISEYRKELSEEPIYS